MRKILLVNRHKTISANPWPGNLPPYLTLEDIEEFFPYPNSKIRLLGIYLSYGSDTRIEVQKIISMTGKTIITSEI